MWQGRPLSRSLRQIFLLSSALLISAATATPLDIAWQAYLSRTTARARPTGGLQPACIPRRWVPPGNVAREGTVVLLHGFSACPQQYDDLGPLLAARGMDVLVPLMPGHGNTRNRSMPWLNVSQCPEIICGQPDTIFDLPTTADGYKEFAKEVNALAALGSAPRALSGISVGGAVAVYAGRAVDPSTGNSLYARQLIINPMLVLAQGQWLEHVLKYLAKPLLWLGWSFPCWEERKAGRGGICTFHVGNVVAFDDFGTLASSNVSMARNASVVVLYDSGDPVVSTVAIRRLRDGLLKDAGMDSTHSKTVHSCVTNFTCHSMLSKWDDVGRNKWWMNELSCKVVNYLAGGIPFPLTSEKNPAEGGDKYCSLACDAETCKFNASEPLSCPMLSYTA